MTMELCDNCDISTASWQCLTCPAAASHLCTDCYELHAKTKQFRDHNIIEMTQIARSCCNCDQSPSKFICLSCDDDDKYLCLGCSVIHPMIKQFRGHTVLPIEPTPRGAGSLGLLFRIQQLAEAHVDNLLTLPCSNPTYWLSLTLLLIILVAYYLLVKAVCGGYAVIVNALVILAMVRYVSPGLFDGKKPHTKPTPTTTPKTSELPVQSEGEWDGESEFGYKLTSKAASFRPRGRPYKPRPSNTNKPRKPDGKPGGLQALAAAGLGAAGTGTGTLADGGFRAGTGTRLPIWCSASGAAKA